MTKPITGLRTEHHRITELPRRLLLQRFEPASKTWGTLNDLAVSPFTQNGVEACAAELKRQQYNWDYNYVPFNFSEWRIEPVYSA